MSDAAPHWFVKIGDDVFGPYPSERVRAFVGEGRLRSHSMVSRRREGGFTPIERIPDLIDATKAKPVGREPRPVDSRSQVAPAPSSPASSSNELTSVSRGSGVRASSTTAALGNFIVIAQFDVTDPSRLVERLSRFGPIEPIGPGAWALRAATSVEALRNELTRGLTARETLFIVDATRDKAAWFNLGAERDARLRALRDDVEPR